MTEMIGSVLNDRYRIVERVARSCLGEVFAAGDMSDTEGMTETTVLMVHGDLTRGKRFLECFRSEVQKLAQAGNPRLARVSAFGSTDQFAFVVFDCSPRVPV